MIMKQNLAGGTSNNVLAGQENAIVILISFDNKNLHEPGNAPVLIKSNSVLDHKPRTVRLPNSRLGVSSHSISGLLIFRVGL